MRSLLPQSLWALAGWLLLVSATPGEAAPELAVVLSKRLRSMEAALRGVREAARARDVGLRILRLDEGANAVDRAMVAMARGEFEGVVTLGAAARSLAAEHLPAHARHVSTLVLPDPLDPEDPNRVRFDASPEEWSRLIAALSPEDGVAGVLASDAVAEARLAPLAAALRRAGRRLLVRRAAGTRGLTRALRELLEQSRVVLLPRDRGLLSAVVVRQIMRRAHEAKVPVVTFSRGLLAAGATAALDLEPKACGAHAAALALGREPVALRAHLSLDHNRARFLGIEVGEELETWLRGEAGQDEPEAGRGSLGAEPSPEHEDPHGEEE